MESFFVSAKAPDAPPRWKMAILLLLVVYPLSLALSMWGGPVLASLPVLVGTLLTSVFMVWLMTYVLVPILTTVFQSWLQPTK
jgi:antibiotic biosynthesis monooxygenase (ABM) superfamily enzyme